MFVGTICTFTSCGSVLTIWGDIWIVVIGCCKFTWTVSTDCASWDWVDNESSAIIIGQWWYVERFGDPIEWLYLIGLSPILVNDDRLCVLSMFAFQFGVTNDLVDGDDMVD